MSVVQPLLHCNFRRPKNSTRHASLEAKEYFVFERDCGGYAVPLTCVGSCVFQNTSSSSSYATTAGSYSTSTTSACPDRPEQTSWRGVGRKRTNAQGPVGLSWSKIWRFPLSKCQPPARGLAVPVLLIKTALAQHSPSSSFRVPQKQSCAKTGRWRVKLQPPLCHRTLSCAYPIGRVFHGPAGVTRHHL